MRKIRFAFRFFIRFLLKWKKLILVGFLLGALSFYFRPLLGRIIPKRQPTQKIGLVGRYTPTEIPLEIQNLISQGLTKLEPDGTPSPSIAERWEIKEEGRIYTFFLKEGITWHDGSKLNSSHINYNFRDVSISVIDDRTVQFNLREPFSPFPAVVSRPIFKKGLIGAGKYKVKKLSRTGQFVESILLVPSKKEDKSPNLYFHFYPTEEAAKTAFKLGEVKILKDILDPNGFEEWEKTEISSQTKFDRFVGVFFNASDPLLEEKGVRQALNYSIEKKQGQERALGPISPLSWAYNENVKPYEFDLENAKTLLEKSFGDREEKIKIKLSTVISLLSEAEKIKTSWEKLGIEVEIGPLTSTGEEFQALLAMQEIPADPDQYSLWHSTQEGNIIKFKNPRIDMLLEEGRKVSDLNERKKIYFDFQRFLVEEAPVIFLYRPTIYTISRE